ncbi:type IV secretion system protein [Loktanella sp. Alg231-35]|uniref:type IV secretion system protein n=1 Tax=Loktanella sp. Alg231-35 TaxID=1922220 RepID=UPI000D55E8FC|nr:type IV secretion system protein [Loktanella sp. Alg231-35]
MSIVTFFVETADGYLEDAAETQFGAVAATTGSILLVAITLLIILVFINMVFQVRSMDGRSAFWLAVKLVLIGIFATNWVQFNSFSTAVLSGIDSIAGALVSSVGGGTPGPSGTFAEAFDAIIAEFSEYMNTIGDGMHWMAGAVMGVVGTVLLSLLGGLAAFFLIAARLMIALLLGLAPIMIFLTLFDVTKDYFARWLSALISFGIYPVIIAGVFATIIGVSNALIAELGDPDGATTIGAVVPFFMMIFMAKGFILATPFLVRAISGNIVMPALSGGLGGAYAFGRAAAGSQQAYNRYQVGTASGAEYAAIRGRQLLGIQQPAQSRASTFQPANNSAPANPAPPQPTGTGAKMEGQIARAQRIRDAGKK